MRPTILLYRVRRPNQGLYFGIFDPASHRIRTERTEQAAAAVAEEMGLNLEGEQEVTHEQWLRITGIITEDEVSVEQVTRDSIASLGQPPKPAVPEPPAKPPAIEFSTDSIDAWVVQRQLQQPSIFSNTQAFVAEENPSDDPASGHL